MNVLKRMIIPKLDLTIRYILSELEELEREDTFRLKRVKEKKMKKVKGDGAGEQIEVTDVEEPKKEETPKPEDKPVVERSASEDKEVPPVAPKEAAEMGDLIIIKPSDFRMELGDVFIPPPLLKTMATITEVEELIEGISDMDKKEKSKEVEEIQPEQKNLNEITENVPVVNLETGEWFETPSKLENRPILNVSGSEYSKMDKYKDVMANERESNSASAAEIPIKADKSIMDIDKRALSSLYKDIDSNYYKPTIDDIFSKHDIAMKDSSSLQDSILEHSLVDLESIDFSIDSKGKVVASKTGTGQSSLALSTHREVDLTKHMAQYDDKGMLIGTMGRQASVKWQDESATTKDNLILQSDEVEPEPVKRILENDVITPAINASSEIVEDAITDRYVANIDKQNQTDAIIKLDKNNESLSNQELNLNDVINDNINNRSVVSLEETEVWTSETEQIPKDRISQEGIIENNGNTELVEEKLSRSISDVKLSRISEEESIDMDRKSKLSTVVEESKEKQIEEEKNTVCSVVSDQFEDSISSFHDNSTLISSYKETSQSGISMKNNNRLNVNNKDLKMKVEEVAENAKQETLENGSSTAQEERLRKVTSTKSSRDLKHSKYQNRLSQHKSQEEFQIDTSNLNETLESEAIQSKTDETSTDIPDNVAELNQTEAKYDRTEKVTTLKESNNENLQDNLQTDHNRLRIEESKKHDNVKEQTDQDKHQNEIKGTTEYDEHKPLIIQDSDEIINTRRDSKGGQSEKNIQSKAQTTNDEEKINSQENTENKRTSKAGIKENKEKPLKILNSDEMVTTNKDNKRTSDDNLIKEIDNKKEEENGQNTSNARTSNIGNRGKHSGDDHVKQE